MRLLLITILILLSSCSELSTDLISDIENEESEAWDEISIGIEQRLLSAESTLFQIVRVRPSEYQFRVHYRPSEPLTIEEWQAELPAAEVIINTNFFTPEHTILGLLIADGVQYGNSYVNRGGTFFVDGHIVGLRSNILEPYAGELFSQAIQAFPMLVVNGTAAYNNANDLSPSRRTIIGQDDQGRIVIMTTPGFGISLYTLSQYLPTSDINFTNALNLDGGGSTMMYIAATDTWVRSFDPVPAVLALYPR